VTSETGVQSKILLQSPWLLLALKSFNGRCYHSTERQFTAGVFWYHRVITVCNPTYTRVSNILHLFPVRNKKQCSLPTAHKIFLFRIPRITFISKLFPFPWHNITNDSIQKPVSSQSGTLHSPSEIFLSGGFGTERWARKWLYKSTWHDAGALGATERKRKE